MIELKRITSDVEPKSFERLGNGSYYYNYDIKFEGTIIREEEEVPQWSFVQVLIYGYPTYEDCVPAIIRAGVSLNEEFNIINSYNKEMLLNTENEGPATIAYKEYLAFVDEVKEKTREAFNKLEE